MAGVSHGESLVEHACTSLCLPWGRMNARLLSFHLATAQTDEDTILLEAKAASLSSCPVTCGRLFGRCMNQPVFPSVTHVAPKHEIGG